MSASRTTDYFGSGTHAARPATPNIRAGETALYYETDTLLTFGWTGSAWLEVNPVPTGGTTSQVLTKNSNADFDVKWA